MNFSASSETSRAMELFQRLESEGLTYILELYATQKSEGFFLDYKSINTPPGEPLSDKDRMPLRKALSSFANSEGGVILWGLTTKKSGNTEKIDEPKGYSDAQRFSQLIDGAISGCTVPPVPGVRSIFIHDGDGDTTGFVATLVPASSYAPHQTADDQRYYMRSGSSSQPVPHGVLAGMFGRRPQPNLRIKFAPQLFRWKKPGELTITLGGAEFPTLLVEVGVMITNESPIPARECYVSWDFPNVSWQSSGHYVTPQVEDGWMYPAKGIRGACIAKEVTKLVPYTEMKAFEFTITLIEPFEKDFIGEIVYGCLGAPARKIKIHTPREVLHTIFAAHIKTKNKQGDLQHQEKIEFCKLLMSSWKL